MRPRPKLIAVTLMHAVPASVAIASGGCDDEDGAETAAGGGGRRCVTCEGAESESEGEGGGDDVNPGRRCLRGAGAHRLYLQGRKADPDADGRYLMTEDIYELVHGEHWLLGRGAFAEWSMPLCADLTGDVYFFIPNADDPGSEARHELVVVREDGREERIAGAVDTQAGNMGYVPFEEEPEAVDLATGPGDTLLFRSTNANGVRFAVMIWRPPMPNYLSYVDVEVAAR